MANLEVVENDVEWIKGSLARIEAAVTMQQQNCIATHKQVDEKINKINIRIILLAAAMSGGITGGIEIIKFFIGKI